jgi:hypothetical protein
MPRPIVVAVTFVIGSFVGTGFAWAEAAPAALRNKTLSVSWTSTPRLMTPRGEREASPVSVHRLIYISSAGRFFVKATYDARSSEAAPGDKTPPGGARDVTFSGGKIIGFGQLGAGAGRMIVSFDRAYTSCRVNVLYGLPKGRHPTYQRHGVTVELLEVTHSGESCSIRQGNAVAGQ